MSDFQSNVNKAIHAVSLGSIQAVVETAIKVTAQAKQLCPVADFMGGNLKGSIQWQADNGQEGGKENSNKLTSSIPKGGAIVGTPVEYGVYQEFGTRKMAAQPFLRPAVDIQAKGFSLKNAMVDAMNNSVSRELPKV